MINISKMSKYYGEYPAVIDVSFNIAKGESIGLLGPNGAGKSTTMKVMTGYTPPTSGNVNIGGYDIIKNSIDARKLIGYLPESVPLYTDMTVKEYLSYMGSLRGMGKNILNRVDEVIDLTSLNQYKNVLISKLSKGYRQRTGIAQAILHKPKILILDEPTIGIDPVQVVETRKLIQNLGEEHTLILSSHILPEVTSLCNRVLVIHEGKIVADDTPENLSNRLQTSNLCEIKVKNGKSNGIIKLLRNEEYIVDIRTKDGENDEFESYYIETSSVKNPESLISKILINNNIELFKLSSLPLTLEEIFLQLTKD
tara:strand:+ start:2251 stop:3183 length:933 start_codon:yes stop_codon:yes gene_type:complete